MFRSILPLISTRFSPRLLHSAPCWNHSFFHRFFSASAIPVGPAFEELTAIDISSVAPISFGLNNLKGLSLVDRVKFHRRRSTDQATQKQTQNQNQIQTDSAAAASASARPADSSLEIHFPFSRDLILQSYYSLFDSDYLRLGRILEDLDAIAADSAYRHVATEQFRLDESKEFSVSDSINSYTIVTAAVYSLNISKAITKLRDLILSARVISTGHSSMEVAVELFEVADSQRRREKIGEVRFVMAARDKVSYKPVRVPQLLAANLSQKEQRIQSEVLESQAARKLSRMNSLQAIAPTIEETMEIHRLYRIGKTRKSEELTERLGLARPPVYRIGEILEQVIDQSATALESSSVAQQQDRNIAKKLFGGTIMRSAYELAWVAGRVATACFPVPIFIDDISFLHPVEIGSVVRYQSRVLYSNPVSHTFIVHVSASVLDVLSDSQRVTNEFYFGFRAFESSDQSSKLAEIPFVMPSSYDEMMGFLEGRRRSKRMKLQIEENKQKS